MAGIGLGWGDANAAMAQELRQQIADRIAAQQRAKQDQQQAFENDYKNRALQQADDLKKAQIAEMTQRGQESAADRLFVQGRVINEAIPPGDLRPPTDPTVAMTQRAGGRWDPQMTLPSTQMQGDITGGDATTTQQAPTPTGLMIHGATQAQQEKALADQRAATEEQRRQAADANNLDIKNWLASIAQGKADQGPKDPTPHYTFMPSYENGVPTGLQIGNTLTGEVTTAPGAAPNRPPPVAPGAGAAATETRNKTTALGTLDQLDAQIEKAKDLIGPTAGRYSSIQQMVGDPNPEIQRLGTFMLGAKLRVDSALGATGRSAASPALLKLWDRLLGNNLDYDAMKGSVQAMRELVGGPGGGGKIQVADPTGAVHTFDTPQQADAFKASWPK
jgi:hypothetical protein